jgi:CubicO group peptidase (beta-lactamase class C family)
MSDRMRQLDGRGWRPGSLLLAIVALAAACTDNPAAPLNTTARHPLDLSAEWSLTSPTVEGVDSTRLAAAYSQASAVPGLTSLLVVRHGHLVGEQYFLGGRADSAYSARSVTKSVMSLLIGIAIDQGRIASTSVPLSTYFQPPLPALDSAKGSITIHDLLTMTSGFQWDEEGNPAEYDNWVSSPDEVQYLVQRPLVCTPGQCWNYNSAAVHLLSVVISRAIAAGTPAFADSVLFTPLGFHPVEWEVFADGYANGGAGLYLRPRDMAKIGALVLQHGVSGHTAVVPAAWIQETTERRLSTPDILEGPGSMGYGELWWVGAIDGHRLVLAWGYGGQFIWIVPDFDLVVVATATWQGLGNAAYTDADAIGDLIATAVMPAVRANQ